MRSVEATVFSLAGAIGFSFLGAITFTGCEKPEKIAINNNDQPSHRQLSSYKSSRLINSKGEDVGQIIISHDEENIYVSLMTMNGWELDESFVFVGVENEIPLVEGWTNPYEFNNHQKHDPNVGIYTYTVDIGDLPKDQIVVVAKTNIKNKSYLHRTEVKDAAWGEGIQLDGISKEPTYISYSIE